MSINFKHEQEKSGKVSDRSPFRGIGKSFRSKIDKVKEYELLEENEDIKNDFLYGMPFGLNYNDYANAQNLKKNLMEKYQDVELSQAIEGHEYDSGYGTVFTINQNIESNLKKFPREKAKEKILSELRLIYGIGETKKKYLRSRGYNTIEDLVYHPYFSKEAKDCLSLIESMNSKNIMDRISYWLSQSDELMYCCSGFHEKEDFLFFDIETLGLFNRPIILIGVAKFNGENLSINQYFLKDLTQEPAALNEFYSFIGPNTVLVSYNGKSFDVPYIRERLSYYGMQTHIEKPHFDMLHFSRRAWRNKYPNCRLVTLEKYLFGIERNDDVPSALVPEFYETYLRTGNIGPVIPIIEHNRQDLITLTMIFSKLYEEWSQ
ncbi:MAG: ribonuclease H-like domain-containing protein [Candidatus Methanofastidiosum sp.]|nr:ribonuclease H-like domain-containing protein [Methanofastidiosum sp.]